MSTNLRFFLHEDSTLYVAWLFSADSPIYNFCTSGSKCVTDTPFIITRLEILCSSSESSCRVPTIVSIVAQCLRLLEGLINFMDLSWWNFSINDFPFYYLWGDRASILTFRYVWFKYDLGQKYHAPKFSLVGAWTHDLQIMTVHFMSLRLLL